jgi:hypothetical protein
MQRSFRSVFLAIAIGGAMMTATRSAAQTAGNAPASNKSAFEVAFTYDGALSEQVANSHFWLQGGSAQIHGQFYGGLGVVADIAGAHIANIHSSGVGLDLVTATFGPRYTWSPAHARYSLFGQGLAGEAFGLNSGFPNPSGAMTSAHSLAVEAGGGVNVRLAPHLALRAVEADYLRTQLPNATNNVQNNLRLGAGIVFRFN